MRSNSQSRFHWIERGATALLGLFCLAISLPLVGLRLQTAAGVSARTISVRAPLVIDSARQWQLLSRGDNLTETQAYDFDGEGLALAPLQAQAVVFPRGCPTTHILRISGLVDRATRLNLVFNDQPFDVVKSFSASPAVREYERELDPSLVRTENTLTLSAASYVHLDRLSISCARRAKDSWSSLVRQATDNEPRPIVRNSRSARWAFAVDSFADWNASFGQELAKEFVPFFDDGQGVRLKEQSSLTLPSLACPRALQVRVVSYQGYWVYVNDRRFDRQRVNPNDERVSIAEYRVPSAADQAPAIRVTATADTTIDSIVVRCVQS